jgi:hypothetical protein
VSGETHDEHGGALILPWPNTDACIRKVVRELRANGWRARVVKTDRETYVRTNCPYAEQRKL